MENPIFRSPLASRLAPPIVCLRAEFAHAVFADDLRSRNTEALRDQRVEFSFRQRTRTTFVTAGFHYARTGRQFEAKILFHQMIEQMDERERGSEKQQRTFTFDRIAERGDRSCEVESPRIVRSEISQKR